MLRLQQGSACAHRIAKLLSLCRYKTRSFTFLQRFANKAKRRVCVDTCQRGVTWRRIEASQLLGYMVKVQFGGICAVLSNQHAKASSNQSSFQEVIQ